MLGFFENVKVSLIPSLSHEDLRVGVEVISLVLPLSDQRLLVLPRPRAPDLTQTWHASQRAGPHVASESDDIHNYRQGDSQQAQPDNVVRVEVAGGQLLVGVVHPVVDVLVLPVALQRPGSVH